MAAVACFASKGFAGTSMRDIVAAAEVTVASAYYYFPTKDRLVATDISHCVEATADGLGLPDDRALSSRDRIRRAVDRVWRLAKQPPIETRVLMELTAQASHDEAMRSTIASSLDTLADQIASQLSMSRRDPDVEALSRFVLGALHGLITLDGYFDRCERPVSDFHLEALASVARTLLEA
jgi:AcrR family transcriptional regulator